MSRENCLAAIERVLANQTSDSSLAKDLEEAIHNLHNDQDGYKNDILSKTRNLKSNPDLARDYVSGSITADELARMTPGDMATPSKKAENAEIRAHNIENVVGVDTLVPATVDDLDPGVVKNTGQLGVEYDAP